MLKGQDILILIKLALVSDNPPRQIDLAHTLGISLSEVSKALQRAAEVGLYDPSTRKVMRLALREVVLHSLKYFFPAKLGEPARGIPTAWAAKPLSAKILADGDYERPVWPHAEGTERGASVEPLFPSVPMAALQDPRLYEVLALVDALRMGRARERKLAAQMLEQRLFA